MLPYSYTIATILLQDGIKALRWLIRRLNEIAWENKVDEFEEQFSKYAEDFKSLLKTVCYHDCLAELKRVGLLGSLLTNLVACAVFDLAHHIIDFIRPENRFDVYKLRDRNSRTILHHAVTHRNHEFIKKVLHSLDGSDVKVELLILPDTAGYTALDHASGDDWSDNSVKYVLLSHFSDEHQEKLIKKSKIHPKATQALSQTFRSDGQTSRCFLSTNLFSVSFSFSFQAWMPRAQLFCFYFFHCLHKLMKLCTLMHQSI